MNYIREYWNKIQSGEVVACKRIIQQYQKIIFKVISMATDVTAFNRMRREQARKQQQTEQKAIPAWEDMTYNELKAAEKEAGIKGYGKISKQRLIEALKAGE